MSIPRYDTDFYCDAVIQDPFAAYADMRALGSVVWLTANQCWAAVQHRPALEALRRPKLFLSGKGLSLNPEVNTLLKGSTLNSDGDVHRKQRAVTANPIMEDQLGTLIPYIEAASETLSDRLVAQSTFDAVADFARILPVSIVVELVGLPDHGKSKMLDWAGATFNLFEGYNERSEASFAKLRELRDFLDIYGKPEHLQSGGLSQRIFEEAPKHGFTLEESAQMMRDYISPSLDTTISTAGFLAYYFAKQPEQWDMLRADLSLIPNAIEEAVRLATPIRAFSRYVAEDVDFHGVQMRQGERLLIVYASANRDEQVFDHPDQFDITRKTHKHLGFGQGVHMCMGMHLARLELKMLLTSMAKRVKRWHFEGEGTTAMNNTICAFETLPVRVEAG